MARRVLVTGGAGFIGSHLVDHLLKLGDELIVVDNFNDFYDPEIKRANVQEHLKNENYHLYEGDLCDFDFVKSIFDRHDFSHVVHLAAAAGVRPSVENPTYYEKNNNLSTVSLLDLAVKAKKSNSPDLRFIFASSSSVYGSKAKEHNTYDGFNKESRFENLEGIKAFKETDDVSKPISPYAATKVAGEALCHTMSYLHDLPIVALRFFTVYGPRQRPDLAIHKFTKLIDEGKEIPVYGDGSFRRDFTYIDDIIDGVLKSLDFNKFSCDTKFEIFNLGESETTDVKTLVSVVEDALAKKAKINYMDAIAGDVPITFADISKSRDLLGYNPQTKLEEGIAKFCDWYKSSKTLFVGA